MEEISIIIPTYNRLNILKRVLKAINEQDYNLNNVEVLVIDDFSENPVPKLKNYKYILKIFRMKKNSRQGMARNEGIKLAKGKYLFFIGDDTIPSRNFLKEHMKLHKKYKNIAVLGKVEWAKEVRNNFMDYLGKVQFHYQNIKDKNNVKLHFYTSNISLEKYWFKGEEYSPKFKNYGFEDLELGYRLEKKGLRVVYNEKAIVYHVHEYNFNQFCERMEKVGRSAVVFAKIHPELRWKYIPPFEKIFKVIAFLLSRGFVNIISKKTYWYFSFVYQYLNGIDKELKNVER